jgi:hypothetical protein
MVAALASLSLLGAQARVELPPVPDGWLQIPYESYHGLEGAYHDRESDAWLRLSEVLARHC